jgi:hypothetical protein
MPARKKARHNPPAKASQAPPNETKQPPKEPTPEPDPKKSDKSIPTDSKAPTEHRPQEDVAAQADLSSASKGNNDTPSTPQSNTPRSTKSWYGTWPRTPKAAPVAQVVTESISATGDSLAKAAMKTRVLKNSPNLIQRKSSSSSHLSPGASTRSLPVNATTTKLNISSDGVAQEKEDKTGQKKIEKTTDGGTIAADTTRGDAKNSQTEDVPTYKHDQPIDSSAQSTKSVAASTKDEGDLAQSQDMSQSSWLGWFARNEAKTATNESTTTTNSRPGSKTDVESKAKVDSSGEPMTGAKEEEPTSEPLEPESPSHRRNSDPTPQPPVEREVTKEPVNRSSWLGIWGSGAGKSGKTLTSLDNEGSGKASSIKSTESAPVPASKGPVKKEETKESVVAEQQVQTPTKPLHETPLKTVQDDTAASGSSWAFWSRSGNNASKETLVKDNVGQLAVAGSPSQSRPQDAVAGSEGMPKSSPKADKIPQTHEMSQNSQQLQSKKNKSTSVEFKVDKDNTVSSGSKATAVDPKGNTASAASASDKPAEKRPSSRRDSTENLLLPLFKQTYPVAAERWGLLQQLSRLFYGKPPLAPHLCLVKDPPPIKHAIAIGVHGYFPGAFIQTVLGRPTGTSIRFSESAASAIHRFTQDHGYTAKTVEKIALEGEGKIEERLDILWKLLLNWIDTIRKADFILVACHSQGVPVAISLVAKLIGFGCVNGARIGICAMAGVNLGPFIDYKSRWISGSAGELFEFAKPDSRVSRGYETALDTVLRFGAKVSYIGSLDDQLVSLHSSTFGIVQHPNIYRAVWIDGRLHIPDFLTHLVGFALKLRNLGISDHGLIRELSNPLAGSLVGGEGHSRIYDDSAVYE